MMEKERKDSERSSRFENIRNLIDQLETVEEPGFPQTSLLSQSHQSRLATNRSGTVIISLDYSNQQQSTITEVPHIVVSERSASEDLPPSYESCMNL